MSLQEERQDRIQKANRLRIEGYDPYPYRFERTHSAADLLRDNSTLAQAETEITFAGRMMTRRRHGRASFAHLMDASGRMQIYVRQDVVGDAEFALFDLLDIGDLIGVRGQVFLTRSEEITIRVTHLELLSKSLRPLPDKWHGLRDIEVRYRQRYLDLIMNPEVRQIFLTRTRIIDTVRQVLNAKGGVEVETPTLQPLYGGASARPFITHHNALDTEFYLRIADELYLKRLIVGSFDCVYEICKDFRNEGMDRSHNPEFTMVEVYWAYHDYTDMMALTEELFLEVARSVTGSTSIDYQGTPIDLTPPWPRRPMLELIREYVGIDVASLSDDDLRAALTTMHQTSQASAGENATEAVRRAGFIAGLNRGNLIEEIFGSQVEHHLVQPTFVTDYPKETSPLAKQHRDNPALTERFELYIWGREMANAFSELNDPLDQRERFEAQMRLLQQGDEEAQPLDEDYLRALEYGMPPTGGLGIGIDRLTMLFANQSSIQDVILFPQMRPEVRIPQLVAQRAQEEELP